MSLLPVIPIDEFDYELPEAQIAQEAVNPRDASKLMVYQQGQMNVDVFRNLTDYLDQSTSLFFNNARVIPARLFLSNANGARIEVFLLQPFGQDHGSALNATSVCSWECLVGNSKKWKSDEVLIYNLNGELIELHRTELQVVTFKWKSGQVFSDLLEEIGRIPLPPYIKHAADSEDALRYQTVYSKIAGSVAAPTAGLHFTDDVMEALRHKGVQTSFVTLHVGAGTFMPVKVENAAEHPMHREFFEIDQTLTERLRSTKTIIAVGTTSCRVLESLYYVAKQIQEGMAMPLSVPQFPYLEEDIILDRRQVADIIDRYMTERNVSVLKGDTSIMITPGYRFKFCQGIITNFHQPKSTLLLLISAFIGDNWRKVYQKALEENFRFLSYGDSSILLP
ncbi:MAG: S-adenosylmethionine:tRNA ribosyltransferase-isomerase [Chitinophagaceae bacterium]